MWRSLLFVPILNVRLVEGAARRGADAIVLDLEAAVPADSKNEARNAIAQAVSTLRGARGDIAVRVNMLGQGGEEDIAAVIDAGADLIVLPHAAPDHVGKAAELAGTISLIPLIESPRGAIDALAIAEASKSVVALGLGVEDYAASMGAPPTPELLLHAAHQVIQAARAACRHPLVIPDTIADYSDLPRFETAARSARRMGAAGGFAIHPHQVEALNRVFTPSQADVREAEALVAAADNAREQGDAIATRRGQMIDAPVEARARAVLALYDRFAR